MRGVAFLPKAFEDFHWWATQDKKIHARITELIRDIDVYKVTDSEIIVVSCRFHYI